MDEKKQVLVNVEDLQKVRKLLLECDEEDVGIEVSDALGIIEGMLGIVAAQCKHCKVRIDERNESEVESVCCDCFDDNYYQCSQCTEFIENVEDRPGIRLRAQDAELCLKCYRTRRKQEIEDEKRELEEVAGDLDEESKELGGTAPNGDKG